MHRLLPIAGVLIMLAAPLLGRAEAACALARSLSELSAPGDIETSDANDTGAEVVAFEGGIRLDEGGSSATSLMVDPFATPPTFSPALLFPTSSPSLPQIQPVRPFSGPRQQALLQIFLF